MTNYNFKDIAGHIHTMPIRAVSIKSAYLDMALHFFKLENESSYAFRPVQINKTNGTVVTVGYNIEINLVIASNDFTRDYGGGITLQYLLKLFSNNRVRCQIAIGDQSTWDLKDGTVDLVGHLEAINSTKGMIVDTGEFLNFSYEIESVEMRPRLLIKMNGVTHNISTLSSITEAGNEYLFN